MTAKKLYKKMYSAARLWLNAQEIEMSYVAPSNIPTHSEYPFIVWQCWLNEYTHNINDALTLYTFFVYPDEGIKFARLNCHTRIDKEIKIKEAA